MAAGNPLKAPLDPGPAILAAVLHGTTPRARVGILLDEIQKAYAIADSEGIEARSRWTGHYSRLKVKMLDACFNFAVSTRGEDAPAAEPSNNPV